jgi:hypothetical protein
VGKYDLEISAPGFTTYKQTGIPVNVNDNLRIDAHLAVGAVNQTVKVQANAVQVQSEDATVGQVVNSQQVRKPLGQRPKLYLIGCPRSGSILHPAGIEHARGGYFKHQHLLQRHAPE